MGLLEVFEDISSWLSGDKQRGIIQKTGGLGIYDVREIDLSIERNDEKYIFDGDSMSIIQIDNQAYIKLNDVRNKNIDLMKVRLLRTPFNEYFISNSATSGTLYLLLGSKGVFSGLTRPFIDIDDVEDAMKVLLSNVYVASDDLIKSDNAEVYVETTGADYEKVKTITVPNNVKYSNYRIKMDLKTTDLGNPARGRVYKNSVAMGTVQEVDSLTYVTKTDDVTGNWKTGEKIELWLRQAWGFERAYARNFKIYGIIDRMVITESPAW